MSQAGGKPTEAGLQRLIDEGEYLQALGVPRAAGGREILGALMQRRREFPRLDRQWNEMHTALLQQREQYDQACAARDQLVAEVRRSPVKAVGERFSKQAVWQRLHERSKQSLPLAARVQAIRQEVREWEKVEREWQAARERLAKEHGELVFKLLDEATNWREAERSLPESPVAKARFTQQALQAAADLVAKLPALDITQGEMDRGEAKRLRIHKQVCSRCHGRRHVYPSSEELDAALEALEQRPGLRSLVRRNPELLDGLMQQSVPCPECTSQVTFTVPAGLQPGWVLGAGKDERGHALFARAGRVGVPEPEVLAALPGGSGYGRHRLGSDDTAALGSVEGFFDDLQAKVVAAVKLLLLPWSYGALPLPDKRELRLGLRGLALFAAIGVLYCGAAITGNGFAPGFLVRWLGAAAANRTCAYLWVLAAIWLFILGLGGRER